MTKSQSSNTHVIHTTQQANTLTNYMVQTSNITAAENSTAVNKGKIYATTIDIT